MTVSIERYSKAEALARLEQIRAEIGDVDRFRERARLYLLDHGEQALLNELEDFEYLLGL